MGMLRQERVKRHICGEGKEMGALHRAACSVRGALCRGPGGGGRQHRAAQARGARVVSRRCERQAEAFSFAHLFAFALQEGRGSGCGFQGC